QGHTKPVASVVLSSDGRRAVSTSYDSTLRVWDLESGKTLRMLHGYSSSAKGVALTPDDRRVVSADYKALRVLDLDSGQSIHTLRGHTGWIKAMTVTPNGRRVVFGSDDGTLRLWDLKDGNELVGFTIDAHVTACVVAQDNRTIVAGDSFGRVHFLRL